MSRTVDEYMQLPYRVMLTYDRDQDGNEGWVAEVAELPGCLSQGATPEEAAAKIRDAMLGWISVALEDGRAIPEPGDDGYSGKFVIRVPSSLHRDLARAARDDGVSLNQFASGVLASAVSWRLPHRPGAGLGTTGSQSRRSKRAGGRGSARA